MSTDNTSATSFPSSPDVSAEQNSDFSLSPTKGGALKVTIPDEMNDDLSMYAAGYNTSKSEAVRNSIAYYMNCDPRWTNRRYFFKPRKPIVSLAALRECSGFVQVACLPKDLPRNAMGITAKLLKYSEFSSIITFDLGYGVVPPVPSSVDGSNIDLGPGSLVMPTVEPSGNGLSQPFIYYQINNNLLWGTAPLSISTVQY